MGKVKERHLHKRTIPTIKYLPFAANNQEVTLPKEHITSNFCNQHFSVRKRSIFKKQSALYIVFG